MSPRNSVGRTCRPRDELELLLLELDPPPPPPLDELELLERELELELDEPDELDELELADDEELELELVPEELLLEDALGELDEEELLPGAAGFSTESQATLPRPTAIVPPDRSLRNSRRRSRRSSSRLREVMGLLPTGLDRPHARGAPSSSVYSRQPTIHDPSSI